ncbi:putative membrane protein [Sporosarcina luteola]|nr:putative membrane protein [Sporosarcina luteola]
MEALFTSTGSLLAIMAMTIALALFLQRFRGFKMLGPALLAIVISVILANLKVVPFSAEVYGVVAQYAIPLSIAMMLLSVDIKAMLKLSKKPIVSIALAGLSVSAVTVGAGIIFAPMIEEGWKVAGMFVGTYTGGSANLTAIGYGLGALPTTFAAANAADYVIGVPTLIAMFAFPRFAAQSKWFQKIWPFSLSTEELEGKHGEVDEDPFLQAKKWSITDIAWSFAIAFGITALATYLAGFMPESFQGAARILFITTIAIIVAQFGPVKKIKGNMDLGLYVALFFLTTIGYMVNIKAFVGSTLAIALFCFVVIILSLTVHALLCRLLKIEYQYVVIGIIASIADGSTSALVAASANWKNLVSLAIVLGVIGVVMGNYLGFGVAYLIKYIIGA